MSVLREGWDVQNVTVVIGLRPYTAAANILPEQAIGRGLHLMFRGQNYTERVDIIGNKKFLTLQRICRLIKSNEPRTPVEGRKVH